MIIVVCTFKLFSKPNDRGMNENIARWEIYVNNEYFPNIPRKFVLINSDVTNIRHSRPNIINMNGGVLRWKLRLYVSVINIPKPHRNSIIPNTTIAGLYTSISFKNQAIPSPIIE